VTNIVGAAGLPVLLALTAAFLYGVSAISSRRGIAHLEPQVAAIVSIGATACTYFATAPLWMRSEDWFTLGFWVFAANGLIHPMLSVYCWLEAIQRAGPTVASTLTATAPLFAALTAITFLDESITVTIALGTLAVVAGIIVLSWGPVGFTSLMKVALVFATVAAMVRGLNHTVGRFGLGLMPNPMMAGFVSCTVAFFGSLTMYRVRNGRFPRRVPRAGLPYMALTGVIVCGGVTAMYSALGVGSVVVVSPLIATYPVFTLVMALALGMEKPSRRLLTGVALVIGGVVAISLARA
jgi:drug/metabolite transporter (DMT)-like permease